ncbi:hypothetical protein N8I77_007091 [Diaporthe amygdali]|uniref:Carboxy-cis,cis-muconate cyclase n=1 Tax=Phomopsis amygdali TaxID=1214568 RepID=A0AAD9SDQ2_PHOAM|nr:hypothetical protein N8I77_007091 [Diaporthe amygdali]
MYTSFLAIFISLVFGINATIHELIVGTFSTKFLYTVEFDDEALTLSLSANMSVPYAGNWIAFNHDKRNLYTTAYGQSNEPQNPKFVSYSVINATAIDHQTTIPAGGNCTATSIFVVADTHHPYNVYGTFFSSVKGIDAGCGSVFSVDEGGALDAVIQNYTYFVNKSGVHGAALSPDSRYLYSADDTGNTLWTHAVDPATGEVAVLANLTGPTPGSDPRHVVVHPKGHYLYVILEGASQLAQYTIDRETGLPAYEDAYSLLLSAQQDPVHYWADEVALSASNKYLWASNRGRSTNITGYVSVFSLDERGAIVKQNFLEPTSSSGGFSNILSPSPYTDEFAVLTDNSTGFVEVWKLDENAGSAAVVAHLDIDDGGGCCSNALWYS